MSAPTKIRYITIGGFLGAGKTTAVQQFASHLDARGLKVGLITNDQGAGLVDSAIGKSNRFPVEEISGGCFCCQFNSLLEASHELTRDTRPDVFIAEPVGSCTDLVATVCLPLQKIYGADYTVTPLSVLIDPVRALRVLHLEEGKKFSENVTYIYRKQLEEAEIICINKIDLLDGERLAALRDGLAREFPEARIFEIGAREGANLEPWFDAVMSGEMNVQRFLEIDYDRYGEGEALLGWLNCTVEITVPDSREEGEFDGNALLNKVAARVQASLIEAGAEVAHLKMTLTPQGDPYEIAAVNLVQGEGKPEQSHRLMEPLDDGELLLNLRAEAAPEILEQATKAALHEVLTLEFGLAHKVAHIEHFRPGYPTPTHRMTKEEEEKKPCCGCGCSEKK